MPSPPPSPALKEDWFAAVDPLTDAPADSNALPTDMQVIGAVQRAAGPDTVVMCAAGTMPGELHKLWKATRPMSYHMEYGFSCMGYEIAGAMGIKMAEPDRDVVCMLGDGSYMMANSELATAVMMGIKITVVITDNRGFGCINRLQKAHRRGGVQQPPRPRGAREPLQHRLRRACREHGGGGGEGGLHRGTRGGAGAAPRPPPGPSSW